VAASFATYVEGGDAAGATAGNERHIETAVWTELGCYVLWAVGACSSACKDVGVSVPMWTLSHPRFLLLSCTGALTTHKECSDRVGHVPLHARVG
jgi:hypothetical protein